MNFVWVLGIETIDVKIITLLGLKNLTELVIKRIKGEVGKGQAKEIKKYLKLSGKILDARKVMKYLAKKDVEVKNAVIERIKNPDLVVKHRTLARVIKFFPYLSNLVSYISPGVDIIVRKR